MKLLAPTGVLALTALVLVSARPVRAQSVRSDLVLTNGQVNAEIVQDGKLFIGGSFTNVGPRTGCAVPVDTALGAIVAGFPTVVGVVNTVVSDSAGGWFLGGTFSSVGGQPRNNLAHVRSDFSVAAWDPSPNQQVLALAFRGGVLYAGGDFTTIGGESRARIAGLDSASGAATAWNPGANATVRALVATDSVLYAGGTFTSLGGQARSRLAAIDLAGGTASPWNPGSNGTVFALDAGSGVVYAGGFFSVLGGQSRVDLAAVDAVTGAATAWNPKPDNQVFAVLLSGSRLYVAGGFTKFGVATFRGRIAAIDVATGNPLAWNPGANSTVLALSTHGPVVYAGGDFTSMGTLPRTFVAAIDSASGATTAWNPSSYGTVNALSARGGAVYVAGVFNGIGGAVRQNLAQVDLGSGALTAWNPDANGQVFALLPRAGTILAGGQYSSVGGQLRNNLAAIDASSGLATSWNPNANGLVSALAMSGDAVYAGGIFSTIGGQSRNNLGAVDATTGLASAWNPNVDGQVFTIAPAAGKVYFGGLFFNVGGQPRSQIAAVNDGSGALLPWNPNANGTVRSMILNCGTMYVGGFFTTLGGQARNRIAILDPSTGLATSWNANSDGPVLTLALEGGALYASGPFTTIGGQVRPRIASINPVSAVPTSWNPGADNIVRAFALESGTLYMGGAFAHIGSQTVSNLAAVGADTALSCPVIALAPSNLPAGRVGIPYSQAVTASGGSAPYCYALTSGTLPAGLSLDASNGQIAGTPPASGSFSFAVTATAANGCQGSVTCTLTILPPCPSIALTPPSLGPAHVSQPYSVSFSTSAGTPPFAFAVTAGALPSGLTLTSAGLLSGTPNAVGVSSFTVSVTDSSGCPGSAAYTLSVFAACTPLAIAPSALPDGTVLSAYDDTLVAGGGRAPYTWSVTSGSLPPGLALDAASGRVSGTPALADTFPVVVGVTDSVGCTGSRAYAMIIMPAPPLAVLPAALPGGSVGDPYARTLATGGGTAPFAWSVTAGSLPDGLTLNDSTGVLSGTPTTAQSAYFGVHVLDAQGRVGERSYNVTIFATAPASFVSATSPAACVTQAHPQVSVAFDYARVDSVPARAVSVTFQLDPARLALATPGSPQASVHAGTWLAAHTNTSLLVTGNGAGSYTVDLALLGQPCGITTGGQLFTVDVVAAGPDGPAAIDVVATRVRDCSNAAIPVAAGPEGAVVVDHAGPAVASDLVALQLPVDGSSGSTTRITLTWTPAAAPQVDLYRAPNGTYPLYVDAAAPPDSALVPGAPWVHVALNPSPGYVDQPATRGVWSYVLVATDSCGARAISNRTPGTLDYFLADVSDETTPGTGDNRVALADVSLLGAHYGISGAGAVDPYGYLDVGPTDDGTPNTRPLPDHQVDFEDLLVFAQSYGIATGPAAVLPLAALKRAGGSAGGAANGAPERFTVLGPSLVEAGNEVSAVLHLEAGGRMQGFSARLVWDPVVVMPVQVEGLGLVEGQGGVVLSPGRGTIDAALLGARREGMTGTGDVARVRFRVLKSGLSGIGLSSIDARDAANHRVSALVAASDLAVPAETVLLAPVPNPASADAVVTFTLARAGRATLSVYAVNGRLVRTLASGVQPAGVYRTTWNGTGDDGQRAAAGVYYLRLEADGRRMNRTLVLLR